MRTDHPRGAGQSHRGGRVASNIGAELTRRVKALCQRSGTSLYMVLLPVYSILLYRHSRLGDFIVFGSVAAYALTPHLGAYCASKAAVNSLMEILIMENLDSGVRIHLTNPPMTNTPLIQQAVETSNPRSIQQGIERNMAADPNKIVDAIEKSLEKNQAISYPGAMAKGLYGMRRAAPGLLWKVIMKSEYAS